MASCNTWFCTDDERHNAFIGFDYCFCNSDCKNTKCGRNKGSKPYAAMLKVCYIGYIFGISYRR